MSRLILCVLLALLLVAPAHAADKMRIVASFSILGDMARQPRSLPSVPMYTAGVFFVVFPTGSGSLSGLSP